MYTWIATCVCVIDFVFLISLTSTVFIVSELKKLIERRIAKRHRLSMGTQEDYYNCV